MSPIVHYVSSKSKFTLNSVAVRVPGTVLNKHHDYETTETHLVGIGQFNLTCHLVTKQCISTRVSS